MQLWERGYFCKRKGNTTPSLCFYNISYNERYLLTSIMLTFVYLSVFTQAPMTPLYYTLTCLDHGPGGRARQLRHQGYLWRQGVPWVVQDQGYDWPGGRQEWRQVQEQRAQVCSSKMLSRSCHVSSQVWQVLGSLQSWEPPCPHTVWGNIHYRATLWR